MERVVRWDDEAERAFAVKHARSAFDIYWSHGVFDHGFSLCFDGYEYLDDNGYRIFLSSDGKLKGTGKD